MHNDPLKEARNAIEALDETRRRFRTLGHPLEDQLARIRDVMNTQFASPHRSAVADLASLLSIKDKALETPFSTFRERFAGLTPRIDFGAKFREAALGWHFPNENLAKILGPAVFGTSLRISEIDAIRNLGTSAISSQLSELNSLNRWDRSFLNSFAASAAFGRLSGLSNTFIGRVSQQVREAVENAENPDDLIESISKITEDGGAGSVWSSFTSYERVSFIVMIVALLVSVYGAVIPTLQYASQEADKATQNARTDTLIRLFERMLDRPVDDLPETTANTIYLVERRANVYFSPSFKSRAMSTLFPGSRVRIIERKHKWVLIEWYDFLSDTPRYGWVNKKYLRPWKDRFRAMPGRD